MSRLNQSSPKPGPLVKAPTLIGWYQAVGKLKPDSRPPPESEDTGTSRPEKLTAGMIARTVVANTAATWGRVKVETSCPKPVDADTKSKVPTVSIANDPLTGTSNRKPAGS